MLSYVIFIFCIALTLAFINAPSKRQNQIIFILCFVCFLLTGFRWEFGGDWEVYYSYFQKINSFALDEGSFEYGWVILSFVVKKLCASYIVFQFLMAAIIFFCIHQSFKKISVVPVLSFMIYFAIMQGGIDYVRSTIATIIIIYSYTYVVEKRLYAFLMMVIFAGAIHASAYIAFPIYWIYHNRLRYRYYFVLFVVCVGLFMTIAKDMLLDFPYLGTWIQYRLFEYINGQENGNLYGGIISVEDAIVNCILKNSVTFLFLFLYCRKAIKTNNILRGLTNVYVAGTILYCSMVPLSIQFARMTGYMSATEIFLYPYIYQNIQKRPNRLLFLLVTISINIYRIAGHLSPELPLGYYYHCVLFQ